MPPGQSSPDVTTVTANAARSAEPDNPQPPAAHHGPRRARQHYGHEGYWARGPTPLRSANRCPNRRPAQHEYLYPQARGYLSFGNTLPPHRCGPETTTELAYQLLQPTPHKREAYGGLSSERAHSARKSAAPLLLE